MRDAETELANTHPNFEKAVSVEARIISLEEACAALPRDAALLEYAFLGEDLLTWAITRQGMVESRVDPIGDLSTSLFMGEFYRCLQKRKPAAVSLQAAQNYLRKLDKRKRQTELANMRAMFDVPSQPALDEVVARHLWPGNRAPTPVDYDHPYYWAPFILIGPCW